MFWYPSSIKATGDIPDVATSIVTGEITITTIDGIQAVFTPDYNVPGSELREILIAKLLPLVSFNARDSMILLLEQGKDDHHQNYNFDNIRPKY